LIDREKLDAMVAEGWLRSQRHPEADLWIYNYTEKTQFEKHWTPETLACRGLILDELGGVRARPFPKFFNYGTPEVGELPAEPFTVTEKVDGSLGILYWLGGEPHIATRGSFTSEQAIEGTKMLRERTIGVELGTTPLFEIVYPENRIVVDYGGRRELVLLGCVDMASGRDFPLPDWDGPVVETHDHPSLSHLLTIERPNREGFVVRFEFSSLRVKVKHADYVRLHRIITGVNARHIWDALRNGQDPTTELDGVPDEIFGWVRDTAAQLEADFAMWAALYRSTFDKRPNDPDRRQLAEWFKEATPNPAVLFRMLDGKPYDDLIWKAIRPEPMTPDTVWTKDAVAA
jgi:RNA ligase